MLARDLVDLEAELRWGDGALDVFGPEATDSLRSRMEAVRLAKRIPARALQDPLLIVKLVAQALRIQGAALESRALDVCFVATLPGGLPEGTFGTSQVVAEMLHEGAREVIALGYEISSTIVLDRLHEMARRGCRVTLIVDRNQTAVEALLEEWPRDGELQLFVGRLEDSQGPHAKMHGKALLVDSTDLLVTSANLTFHGLSANIELGVRLRGAPAHGARAIFEHMLRCGALEDLSQGRAR